MSRDLSPKSLLAEFGLSPKHHFGQNFLSDQHLCSKIARVASRGSPAEVSSEEADAEPAGTAVEIGAGLGNLTSHLLKEFAAVTAIERDRDLVPVLTEIFADDVAQRRLTVVEDDAKTVDYTSLFATSSAPHVLVGNLPYNITGQLLRLTCTLAPQLSRAVFLVQLEVANRLCAKPGGANYGALTVFVGAQFHATRAFIIKRGAFRPQPRVDSAVVKLEPRADPIEENQLFRALVSGAFHQRRKKLRNAWRCIRPPEELAAAAKACAIELDLRGETLSVQQFAAMARELNP